MHFKDKHCVFNADGASHGPFLHKIPLFVQYDIGVLHVPFRKSTYRNLVKHDFPNESNETAARYTIKFY